MRSKPSMWLMFILLMFPQIVETIYSPALHSIATSFNVSDAQASQTLSVYFIAFAFGVVFWGIAADKWGRRPTMLLGIIVYGLSSMIALLTDQFTLLIIARIIAAFGIAVGSVVTQTMLRDVFNGEELGKVFSLMSMGIALGPVFGMAIGGQLVHAGGHQYVFATLVSMAMLLGLYCLVKLPETQRTRIPLKLTHLCCEMIKDGHIWYSTLMIAFFNIALFSYYQLGAFLFSKLGYTATQFGYSGAILGLSIMLGSYINGRLLKQKVSQTKLMTTAVVLLIIGSVGVYFTLQSLYFVLMMGLVVVAFGIAIPNIISNALNDYKQFSGSAGAILGLIYYLQIGIGLTISGLTENLAITLLMCSTFALTTHFIKCRQLYRR
ncbi:multidrug effflux MFS transporter [Vibrio pectenicida]|uniref:Bcr/CflA family efflux transporter n=1 Tax=Vibrio pectenicida TaxID=62763 RepID=A0A427U1W8_9VIBR|nr:multidrug effflux MFS transporter [Vibrio pectenicida]RSD30640.1 Bcr/CflA family efflux MFS transporter [Vibrio pectenicida]